jgi:hypothetical protein
MLPRSFAEDEASATVIRMSPPAPIRRVALAWSERPLPAATAFTQFVTALAAGAGDS